MADPMKRSAHARAGKAARYVRLLASLSLAVPGAALPQSTPPDSAGPCPLAADCAMAPAAPSSSGSGGMRRPWHVELGGFYQKLDRGYGDWRGVNLKLQYSSRRFTPFFTFSSQTRREGTQQNYGLASYISLHRHAYAIVGASTSPGGGPVLYPQFRWDVQGLVDVVPIKGLVVAGGLTQIYYRGPAGGRIISAGSLYYRGRAILSGTVRFNKDNASGERSHLLMAGGQYGSQGSYWIGGSVSRGTEAYRVLSQDPFDARFESVGASVFLQKWLSPATGFAATYDFEHKLDTYHRNGLSLSYFFDF